MKKRSGIHVMGAALGLVLLLAFGTAAPAAAGVEGSTWGRVKALYGDSGTRFDADVPESQAQAWSTLRARRGPTLQRLISITPVQRAGTEDCFVVLGEGTGGTVTADIVSRDGEYMGGIEGRVVRQGEGWRFEPVNGGSTELAFTKEERKRRLGEIRESVCAALGTAVYTLCRITLWNPNSDNKVQCYELGLAVVQTCIGIPHFTDASN